MNDPLGVPTRPKPTPPPRTAPGQAHTEVAAGQHAPRGGVHPLRRGAVRQVGDEVGQAEVVVPVGPRPREHPPPRLHPAPVPVLGGTRGRGRTGRPGRERWVCLPPTTGFGQTASIDSAQP